MKLTKLNKEAIVRRIMADVPQVDYQAQVQKLIEADMIEFAPYGLGPLLLDKDLRTYLITGHHTTDAGAPYSSHSWGATIATYRGYTQSPEVIQALIPVLAAATLQMSAQRALRAKVKASIDGCNTRAQVMAAFPEFEKYLPDEPPKVNRSLPTLANLVADLSKAGWPK